MGRREREARGLEGEQEWKRTVARTSEREWKRGGEGGRASEGGVGREG